MTDRDCILFSWVFEGVVTGSEYVKEGIYVLRWKRKVSILVKFDARRRDAYVSAFDFRKMASLRKLPLGAGQTPRVRIASHGSFRTIVVEFVARPQVKAISAGHSRLLDMTGRPSIPLQ